MRSARPPVGYPRRVTIEDLRRTQSVLRPLYCEHQGWFTYVNVLAQLGHPRASRDELEMLKGRFARLAEWTGRLQKGEALIRADGSTDDEESVAEVGTFARSLAAKLLLTANAHGHALHAPIDDREASIRIAAVNAWAAYAYEHTIKVTIAFANLIGDADEADRTLQQVPLANSAVRDASVFVGALKKGAPPDVLRMLRSQTAHLPGLFEARADEIDALAG